MESLFLHKAFRLSKGITMISWPFRILCQISVFPGYQRTVWVGHPHGGQKGTEMIFLNTVVLILALKVFMERGRSTKDKDTPVAVIIPCPSFFLQPTRALLTLLCFHVKNEYINLHYSFLGR